MSVSYVHINNRYRLIICILFLLLCASVSSCNSYSQNVIFLYEVDDYPASHLVWSPTGKYLAITSRATTSNASSIYILDVVTKEANLLMTTDYGHIEAEAWSPDETELVFFVDSSNELSDGVWIAKINNNALPRLYLDDVVAFGWSPTNQIVIGRNDQLGNRSIYLQDPKTEEGETISLDQRGSIGPFSWSTNGTKLTFSLDYGEFRRRDIFIIDIDTREILQITNEGTNDYPSLSPSGNMVIYKKGDFSGITPTYPMHIMNSDGTCDMKLSGLNDIKSPAWSPDGKWIAFVGEENRIYLYDVQSAFGEGFLEKGLSCN